MDDLIAPLFAIDTYRLSRALIRGMACYVAPLLLAIDLYRLSLTLIKGFRSGAVTITSGDLTGVFALLMLGLLLHDSVVLNTDGWGLIRHIPEFMGAASLGVVAARVTLRASGTTALTFRMTEPYWIAIYLAEIALYRVFRA